MSSKRGIGRLPSAFLAVFLSTLSAASPGDDAPVVLAPFYTGAEYEPPPVGSYQLHTLGHAADGPVLTTAGESIRLHEVLDDKVVLLSFIYSSCTDTNGCPLATAVMYKVLQESAQYPGLKDDLRLVSLSFDPDYDTPEVMRLYGGAFAGEGDWEFLTTDSWDQLQPILEAYNQSVIRDLDDQGGAGATFSHILRVFLIDDEARIRNIYSASFLHPELILNDIKTILREDGQEAGRLMEASLPAQPGPAASGGQGAGALAKNDPAAAGGEGPPGREPMGPPPPPRLSEPGDYKGGYETAEYTSRAKAVELRQGRAVDLLAIAQNPPLGLPEVPTPEGNPLTREKIQLGRKLFFDRRLSLNDTISCAMCHVPEQGFTSHELATAVGFEGRSVHRNAPTLYNVAFHKRLFHDGREENLEQQVWAPLLAHNEMANPSVGRVLQKIRGLPDYQGRFEEVFGERGLSMETLGMAFAAYQRTLVSGDSAFDRWYFGGDESAISPAAKRGFEHFTGKAGCASCHTIGDKHALFTDNGMYNTGLGYRDSMGVKPPTQRVMVAPGVFLDVDREIIDSVGEPRPPDVGLYEITQNPHDRWKYRTPTLRNVALTAPYMHNGTFSTLREVVEFYNGGGVPNELLDPRIRPLGLSDQEMDELVAFLRSLTGSNVDALVADAFAAPIGDISRDDPHWAHENPGRH